MSEHDWFVTMAQAWKDIALAWCLLEGGEWFTMTASAMLRIPGGQRWFMETIRRMSLIWETAASSGEWITLTFPRKRSSQARGQSRQRIPLDKL